MDLKYDIIPGKKIKKKCIACGIHEPSINSILHLFDDWLFKTIMGFNNNIKDNN